MNHSSPKLVYTRKYLRKKCLQKHVTAVLPRRPYKVVMQNFLNTPRVWEIYFWSINLVKCGMQYYLNCPGHSMQYLYGDNPILKIFSEVTQFVPNLFKMLLEPIYKINIEIIVLRLY